MTIHGTFTERSLNMQRRKRGLFSDDVLPSRAGLRARRRQETGNGRGCITHFVRDAVPNFCESSFIPTVTAGAR